MTKENFIMTINSIIKLLYYSNDMGIKILSSCLYKHASDKDFAQLISLIKNNFSNKNPEQIELSQELQEKLIFIREKCKNSSKDYADLEEKIKHLIKIIAVKNYINTKNNIFKE